MKRKSEFSASAVISALREGPFREPAHALLQNVRNETGYGRKQTRYADAIVVSLWPSRGLWIAGIEVKVDRADWRRELDDPQKSIEIQRFCDYWYVAAPPGIVDLGEVPETWGLLTAPRAKGEEIVTKPAPKLTPEPLSKEFVASILRNEAGRSDGIRMAGRAEGRETALAEFGKDAVEELREQIAVANRAKFDAESERDWLKNDVASMKGAIRLFEISAGLPEHTINTGTGSMYLGRSEVGEQFKAAQLLAQYSPTELAEQFRKVADALAALGAVAKGDAA